MSGKFLLALFFVMPISAQTWAQTQLSLSSAIDEAASSSPKVQKAKSVMNESSWGRVASYAGFLPRLTASGNYLLDKRYMLVNVAGFASPIPQVVPNNIYVLNAELPLFDGFESTNKYLAASSNESAATKEYDWAQFVVSREVALQFYKALGAKVLQEVAEQNVKTLDDHLKDVNLFKKAGVSTNYDVLRVEVQVSESKSELLNAQDNVAISKSKLSEILGLEADNRELTGKLPVLNSDLIANLNIQSVNNRSDLVALSDRTEALTHQESAASRYFVPKISAFGQYQYYNNINERMNDTQAFRDAYQYGIMFTWNIFDGMGSIAKSKASVEQRYQIEKNLQIARLKAKQDFEFWKRKFVYFCSVYKSRLNDVEKSKETLRLAKEGRRVGARTNTDLLDAETELYRAQAGAVNAQIGAVEALINLELATGQKIYEFN